jgi:hypothetical protein
VGTEAEGVLVVMAAKLKLDCSDEGDEGDERDVNTQGEAILLYQGRAAL